MSLSEWEKRRGDAGRRIPRSDYSYPVRFSSVIDSSQYASGVDQGYLGDHTDSGEGLVLLPKAVSTWVTTGSSFLFGGGVSLEHHLQQIVQKMPKSYQFAERTIFDICPNGNDGAKRLRI